MKIESTEKNLKEFPDFILNYKSIVESLLEGLWVIDENAHTIYVNKRMAEILAYDKDEMMGRHLFEFMDDESKKNAQENLDRRRSGIKEKHEFKFLRKDGKYVDVLLETSPIMGENGRFIGAVAYVKDISIEKETKERINLSYKLLEIANKYTKINEFLLEFIKVIKEYSNCSSVGIRVLDKQGNIPYRAFEGFPHAFHELENLLSIYKDNCMCINVIKGTTNPNLPFYSKKGSFYINGTTKFLATVSDEEKGSTRNKCNEFGYESVALIPISLGNQILGLIHLADFQENMVPIRMVEILEESAMHLGVTLKRMIIEEELLKSEEKFKLIFHNANDAIFIYDFDGKFLEVNQVACERLKYSREELLKMTKMGINSPECYEEVISRINILRQQGEIIFETEHLRSDGTKIPIEMSSKVIEYDEKPAILSIARDISERINFEKLKKQFITSIFHELRTPLTVLVQSTNNLEKYPDKMTTIQQSDLISKISYNLKRITELIDELSVYSSLNIREIKLEWMSYHPLEIILEILAKFKLELEQKNITPNINVNKNLQLFGDPKLLNHVFWIIIDNAIKYSDKNATISINAQDDYLGKYNPKDMNGILLQFSDTGRGIKPEDIPFIFEKLYRSEDVSDIPGTGYGLYTARELIHLHQGEIYFESEYGKGSTFYIFLPKVKSLPKILRF